MGLGYAVTRDLAPFLRYSTQDDQGNPNPLVRSATEVGIRRAYGSGSSSTGMYLRDFLYLGFNEDEKHRPVDIPDVGMVHEARTLASRSNPARRSGSAAVSDLESGVNVVRRAYDGAIPVAEDEFSLTSTTARAHGTLP